MFNKKFSRRALLLGPLAQFYPYPGYEEPPPPPRTFEEVLAKLQAMDSRQGAQELMLLIVDAKGDVTREMVDQMWACFLACDGFPEAKGAT